MTRNDLPKSLRRLVLVPVSGRYLLEVIRAELWYLEVELSTFVDEFENLFDVSPSPVENGVISLFVGRTVEEGGISG
jgi:hypothetical protein